MSGGESPCFNLPAGQPAVALLGLGSNLGNRREYLERALALLRELGTVTTVSRIYESEPVGFAGQPDFWNLVAEIRTELEPLPLFHRLEAIEVQLGRQPSFRNAPREIDIDILAYDQRVMHTAELDIPHPRMTERSFVLLPLLEVAPSFLHPETGASITELLARLISRTRANAIQP